MVYKTRECGVVIIGGCAASRFSTRQFAHQILSYMTDTTVTVCIRSKLVADVRYQNEQEQDTTTDETRATINIAVCDSHLQQEELPDLQSATRVVLQGDDRSYNNALIECVLPSVLRCNHLVELQICQCKVSRSCRTLEFPELWQLKKLTVTHCGLSFLHPSIGALARLEELNLAHNSLSFLPNALQYCSKLRSLDLRNNSFTALPGVILKLSNLETLKRSDNGLMSGINQYQSGNKFQPLSTEVRTVQGSYNPDSLQFFCTKQLLSVGIHPCRYAGIAYRLRGVMADKQAHMHICDQCNTAGKDTDSGIWVTNVVNRFVGNTYIPFRHVACSQQCADKIYNKIEELSKKSEREMDELSIINDCVHMDDLTSHETKTRKNRCRRRLRICTIM